MLSANAQMCFSATQGFERVQDHERETSGKIRFFGNTSNPSLGIIKSVLEVMLKNLRGSCMSKAEDKGKLSFGRERG